MIEMLLVNWKTPKKNTVFVIVHWNGCELWTFISKHPNKQTDWLFFSKLNSISEFHYYHPYHQFTDIISDFRKWHLLKLPFEFFSLYLQIIKDYHIELSHTHTHKHQWKVRWDADFILFSRKCYGFLHGIFVDVKK